MITPVDIDPETGVENVVTGATRPAPQPESDPENPPVVSSPSPSGSLTITRKAKTYGGCRTFVVFKNGERVGTLANGGTCVIEGTFVGDKITATKKGVFHWGPCALAMSVNGVGNLTAHVETPGNVVNYIFDIGLALFLGCELFTIVLRIIGWTPVLAFHIVYGIEGFAGGVSFGIKCRELWGESTAIDIRIALGFLGFSCLLLAGIVDMAIFGWSSQREYVLIVATIFSNVAGITFFCSACNRGFHGDNARSKALIPCHTNNEDIVNDYLLIKRE